MIALTNVSKRFDDVWAVNKVSLTMQEGNVFGLIGTNGIKINEYTPLQVKQSLLQFMKCPQILLQTTSACTTVTDQQYPRH